MIGSPQRSVKTIVSGPGRAPRLSSCSAWRRRWARRAPATRGPIRIWRRLRAVFGSTRRHWPATRISECWTDSVPASGSTSRQRRPRKLALAHAGGHGQHVERLERIPLEGGEQLADLGTAEGPHLASLGPWRPHRVCGVAGDQVPKHRGAQGAVQDGVQLRDRRRRAGLAQGGIAGRQMLRRQLAQRQVLELAQGETDMAPVALQGARPQRRAGMVQPGAQVGGQALVRPADIEPGLAIGEGLRQLAADLASGRAVDEVAALVRADVASPASGRRPAASSRSSPRPLPSAPRGPC